MKISSISGLSLALFAFSLTGCKKTETDNISRVKNYASIVLTNGPAISVPLGSTFTDPGNVTTLGGAALKPKITGSVDTSTPGVYTISYQAANTEGDTTNINRLVAVVDPAVVIDQSGTFERAGFAANPPATWKLIARGLYRSANFGGAVAGSDFPAYFAQVTPNLIVFPTQNISGVGKVTFNTPTSTFNTAGVLTSYSYAVGATGFGTAVRTFNRR